MKSINVEIILVIDNLFNFPKTITQNHINKASQKAEYKTN